jgi:hypothetical protein
LSTQDGSPLTCDLDIKPEFDINWKEGIEEFQKMRKDNLWEVLELPKGSLPFFNELEYPHLSLQGLKYINSNAMLWTLSNTSQVKVFA